MPQTDLIQRLTAGLPITAGSFIVTVYGDVVVPRGEVLWIGSLIAICARIGISENLVRTAVSRLVAAGRLEGERVGRRSFYRLAPAARAEFAEAARLLYARSQPSGDWLVLLDPDLPEDLARRHRMARIGGDLWLCPARGDLPASSGLVLRATAVAGADQLPQLARFWDLEALAARYRDVLDRFTPVASGTAITPDDALIARLLLVHLYRGVLLRDPGLPPEALPRDWPGTEAQGLFRSLYPALTPQAEAHIARVMEGEDGPLAEATPRSQARLQALA
jgi:phenylacetic acid degradation operon negative regulatory protein